MEAEIKSGRLTLLQFSNCGPTPKERQKLLDEAGEDAEDDVAALISAMEAIAVPKAVWMTSAVEHISDDTVAVDGVRICSELMSRNFAKINRVFPYVVTCGRELSDYADGLGDPFLGYFADELMKLYLYHAFPALNRHITGRLGITGHFSAMNPGSLGQWPISGQEQLFEILGREQVRLLTGVELKPSMLMFPTKTGSGIGFTSETSYENCMLCPRDDCPNRRAPRNPDIS